MLITGNVNMSAVINDFFVPRNTEAPNVEQVQQLGSGEDMKVKVQEVVGKMNKMLGVHNNSSRFVYHEGLERYYVAIVDSETQEVVREIPPKKFLDAFYDMQKKLGKIVDKKI